MTKIDQDKIDFKATTAFLKSLICSFTFKKITNNIFMNLITILFWSKSDIGMDTLHLDNDNKIVELLKNRR